MWWQQHQKLSSLGVSQATEATANKLTVKRTLGHWESPGGLGVSQVIEATANNSTVKRMLGLRESVSGLGVSQVTEATASNSMTLFTFYSKCQPSFYFEKK